MGDAGCHVFTGSGQRRGKTKWDRKSEGKAQLERKENCRNCYQWAIKPGLFPWTIASSMSFKKLFIIFHCFTMGRRGGTCPDPTDDPFMICCREILRPFSMATLTSAASLLITLVKKILYAFCLYIVMCQ